MTQWHATWHERPRSTARYRDRVWREPARRPRGRLRYTDREWAVICRVAATAGMRPGAWAQQAATDAAVAAERGLGHAHREDIEAVIGEIREHRRVLTNVGGLANQLAAAANATGELAAAGAAVEVMDLVRRVVLGGEQLISDIRRTML